jgi:amicyanin
MSIASTRAGALNCWSDEMTHLRRTAMLGLGVLLCVTLAACGGSSSGGSNSPSVAAGPTVTIKDFKFSPATLNVKVGTTVTFVQEDSVPHNVTGGILQSPTLTTGQTYTATFTKAGTYPYICSIHPFMHGTVVVS